MLCPHAVTVVSSARSSVTAALEIFLVFIFSFLMFHFPVYGVKAAGEKKGWLILNLP
jgi:hypothetical protein